jgi:hypothetical protein
MASLGMRAARPGLGFLLLCVAAWPSPARAVPAFAVQTGQPCASCHVGAFGPQLKPFGRDFKLHGYQGNDGQDHGLPLAATFKLSFTHTGAPQPGGAAPGYGANDNFAFDTLSLYYAGRMGSELGGFIETTFDGVAQKFHSDNTDIRHVGESQLFGQDLLWGLTANNAPTVADPWNSTPIWGFPYNRSPLAPTPMATTLVDGGLAQRVFGAGAYMVWNNLLYSEFDVYKGLDAVALTATGQDPDGFNTTAFFPYGRLALFKDFTQHHFEIGAYALTGNVVPGGNQTFGFGTRVTDTALDANYQFMIDPNHVTGDMISAHATFIHEVGNIDPSAPQALFGTFQHTLDTVRADVSVSFAATVTPTIQYFRTSGTTDPAFWGTPNGSPNSEGTIFEVAYVPFGKPDSKFNTLNLRLAVQYVDYFVFDGTSVGARDNNNFYFSLWTAVKF